MSLLPELPCPILFHTLIQTLPAIAFLCKDRVEESVHCSLFTEEPILCKRVSSTYVWDQSKPHMAGMLHLD